MIIAVGIFLFYVVLLAYICTEKPGWVLSPLCAIPISISHYHRTVDKSHSVTFFCHVFQIHWSNPLWGQRNAILKELIKMYLTNPILQIWGHGEKRCHSVKQKLWWHELSSSISCGGMSWEAGAGRDCQQSQAWKRVRAPGPPGHLLCVGGRETQQWTKVFVV